MGEQHYTKYVMVRVITCRESKEHSRNNNIGRVVTRRDASDCCIRESKVHGYLAHSLRSLSRPAS